MAKQLYYSELHLKDIEIYLSKLYISRYYEVQDVIVHTMLQKASIYSGRITNYVTCASGCFV